MTIYDAHGKVYLPSDTTGRDVWRIVRRHLSGDDLQQLYDVFGRSIPTMRKHLGMVGFVSNKRLARYLYEQGVLLHPKDLRKSGIESPREMARLEASDYAAFDLGDGFDPEAMMEEAVESDLDPSIFSDMDIRELPNPKNFFEWVTDRRFLATTIFPRQFQLNLAIFEEWCPYCSDRDFAHDIHLSPYMGEDGWVRPWTNDEILERVTLLEHGKCPKCKKTKIDALRDPDAPHCFPKELDACIGQRAGKTRGTEHSMTYNNARFQLLSPSPQQFFGEDVTQKFSAIFTALQLSQANDTLWGAYHLRVQLAPWFKTYHKWLDDHGQRLGVELYRIKDTYHFYKNSLLHSVLRPPFAKEMRGRTGFQMGIDEIGMFAKGEGAVKANADEVHKSMNNAMLTVRAAANRLVRQGRYDVPTPATFCISSPWEILDKIMTLVRTADRDPTRVAFHYATWEFNPRIRRDDEQMSAEFANDPVAAERDFGAIPPFAKDPFHPNPETIDRMVVPSHQMCFVQKTKYARTRSGKFLTYGVPVRMRPDKVTPRLLVVDAGEADNSFAITMWSLADLPAPPLDAAGFDDIIEDEEDEDIRVVLEAAAAEAAKAAKKAQSGEEQKGVVSFMQLDGCIEVSPFITELEEHYKVSFKRTWEQCVKPILQAFNIVGLIGDRWNITQMMNAAEEMGVYTEQYSLVRNDFLEFKAKTDSREFRLPGPEIPLASVYEDYHKAVRGSPILHLLVQWRTVRNVGRTVAKPAGGTDDLYRTAVLAHRFAFSEKATRELDGREITFYELLHTAGKAEKVKRAVSVVMMRGQGTGGSRGQSGGGFTKIGGYVSRGTAGGGNYSNVATRSRGNNGGNRR